MPPPEAKNQHKINFLILFVLCTYTLNGINKVCALWHLSEELGALRHLWCDLALYKLAVCCTWVLLKQDTKNKANITQAAVRKTWQPQAGGVYWPGAAAHDVAGMMSWRLDQKAAVGVRKTLTHKSCTRGQSYSFVQQTRPVKAREWKRKSI